MVILENIDIDIDIDKAILQNIDIDRISNRFKFGISNRARGGGQGGKCRTLMAKIMKISHFCDLKKPNDWFSYAICPPGCKTGSSTRTRGELGVKTGTGKNIVIIAMSHPFVEIDIKMRREREMKWQTWAGIIACWWWWPCHRRGLRGSAKPKRGEEVQAN